MIQFYVCIIFLAIILICSTFVWIIYDKRNANNYEKRLDSKKQELITIINDAEQMVEELNKFSDYIVEQVNLKDNEMIKNLKNAEDRIFKINEDAQYLLNLEFEQSQFKVKEEVKNKEEIKLKNKEKTIKEDLSEEELSNKNINKFKSNVKVIPMNARYKDVVNLSRKGLNKSEIAKMLDIGKGEIELILEVSGG